MKELTQLKLSLLSRSIIILNEIIEAIDLPIPKCEREAFINDHEDRLEAQIIECIDELLGVSDALPLKEESLLNDAVRKVLLLLSTLTHSSPLITETILKILNPSIERIVQQYEILFEK